MKKLFKLSKCCTYMKLPDFLNYLEDHVDCYYIHRNKCYPEDFEIGDIGVSYREDYCSVGFMDILYYIYRDRITNCKRWEDQNGWHFSKEVKMNFSPEESERMFSQVANIYNNVNKKYHRTLSYNLKKYPYIWAPILGSLFWYGVVYLVEKIVLPEKAIKTPATDTIRYKETDQDSANINPVNTFIYNARQNTK